MDGRAPGDRSSDPAELLRGALEKIVYFECRVSQLESELRAAVKTAERAAADASSSHRKAVELEGALAAARGAREESERRAASLGERVQLLEVERERLLAGLVEQARVAGAPGAEGDAAGDQADLAGFIAELRGEIEELRRFKESVLRNSPSPAEGAREGTGRSVPAGREDEAAMRSSPGWEGSRAEDDGARSTTVARRGSAALTAPEPSGPDARHPSVGSLAGRLAGEGRVGISARDAGALGSQLTTASDRVLFEEAVERLRAPEPEARLRAVRRLEALGPKAASPLLAAAVGREQDAEVKVALLGALGRVEEPFAADIVGSALRDPRPAVRAAALDAFSRLAPDRAEACTLAALADESPIVRRRAALLLGFSRGPQADEALAATLRDADAGVARAAAASLAGRPSAAAQQALARALEHPDPTVRRAAAESLGRWSGERLDGDAPEHERRRASRRIAERLAAMAPAEVRSAVVGAAERRAAAGLAVHRFSGRGRGRTVLAPVAERPAPRAPPLVSVGPRAPASAARPSTPAVAATPSRSARAAVAVVERPFTPGVDEGSSPPRGELAEAIVAELRAALRGRSLEELAGLLSAPAAQVEGALRALAARGEVVARGPRWYVG